MTDQPPDDTALREAARYWGSLGGKAKSVRKAESSRQNLIKARMARNSGVLASAGGQDSGTGLNPKENATSPNHHE